MSVDVGEGWRRLNDGERIEAGDEYEQYGWNPATKTTIGSRVAHYHCPYRRRVPAATADAPTPQPVAWGVWGRGAVCGTAVSREDAVCMQREFAFDTDIRPLYADPPALSQPTPSHGDVVAALECLTSAIGCYGERIADPFTITWGNGIVALRRGVFVAGGSDHVVREVMKLDGKDHRQTTFSAATAAATTPVDPGEGWRLLRVGERIEEGDEYLNGDWCEVNEVNGKFVADDFWYRRRVPAATADAHPRCRDVDRNESIRADEDARAVTLPEWRELPGIVATLLNEAVEARKEIAELHELFDAQAKTFGRFCISRDEETSAVCQRLVALEQGPSDGRDPAPRISRIEARVAALESAAKLAPAANADAEAKLADAIRERDESIRAEEDSREVTFPEWRELPGIVADQVRTIANVLDVLGATCARVAALEYAPKLAPAANDDAESNLGDVIYERDWAIRERDEARARVAELERQVSGEASSK